MFLACYSEPAAAHTHYNLCINHPYTGAATPETQICHSHPSQPDASKQLRKQAAGGLADTPCNDKNIELTLGRHLQLQGGAAAQMAQTCATATSEL